MPVYFDERPSIRVLRLDRRAQVGGTDILELAIIGLISIFVVALFAANILPTLFNQTQVMSQNPDLSTGDQALVLVFNTLAVVAFVLIPVALVFLIVRIMRRSRRD